VLCKKFEVDLLPDFDLVDFYRGKLTLRRLALLAGELPHDSRVHKEMLRREFDGEDPWGPQEILAAATVDELRLLNWIQVRAQWMKADEKNRGPAPEPPERIPIPGYKQEPQHEMDTSIEFGTRADWDALMALT
jgi:hypothetical protein